MNTFRNSAATLILGLAVFAAGPASAREHVHPSGAAAYAQAIGDDAGGYPITRRRAEALRECGAIAAPYAQPTFGDMQLFQWRACMSEHGQIE
jgi:hypothetical protein